MKELQTKQQNPFSVPKHHRSRTSDVLLALVESTYQNKVTLGSLTGRLGDRTFGLLLILIAVFNVIPFVSIFSGLIVTVLGLQLAIGMTKAKLPNMIMNWELPPERVRSALILFEPNIRRIEKYIRPRWQLWEAPVADQLNGVIVDILGIIIALPLPFINLAPAMVIIVMGLGVLERDGLVQFLALGLSLLSILLIYVLFL